MFLARINGNYSQLLARSSWAWTCVRTIKQFIQIKTCVVYTYGLNDKRYGSDMKSPIQSELEVPLTLAVDRFTWTWCVASLRTADYVQSHIRYYMLTSSCTLPCSRSPASRARLLPVLPTFRDLPRALAR